MSCMWPSASPPRSDAASTSPVRCSTRALPTAAASTSIIPPLSLKGPCLSIRKFSQTIFDFSHLVKLGHGRRRNWRWRLEIAARCRLNIIISGGTGSGKTTLLNAFSSMIDPGERIITIEDAAELKLSQEHVVQLETRPANMEGTRRDRSAGARPQRAADAPGPDHRRRGSRRGSFRHDAGHEHGP